MMFPQPAADHGRCLQLRRKLELSPVRSDAGPAPRCWWGAGRTRRHRSGRVWL